VTQQSLLPARVSAMVTRLILLPTLGNIRRARRLLPAAPEALQGTRGSLHQKEALGRT